MPLPLPQIFGHRGAAAEAPENTIAGIRHAISIGVRQVEIDLRLSADQQLVVIHDYSLSRTTGNNANVSDLTAKQLALLEANKSCNDAIALQFSNKKYCGVPTLEALMDYTAEIDCYQLEIKSDSSINRPQLIKALTDFFPNKVSAKRVVITSFDGALIKQIKGNCPYIRTGLIAKKNGLQALKQALNLNCNYLCLHYGLLLDEHAATFIEMLKPAGLHISVWTVNQEKILKQLISTPVDSIITDNPSQILAINSL